MVTLAGPRSTTTVTGADADAPVRWSQPSPWGVVTVGWHPAGITRLTLPGPDVPDGAPPGTRPGPPRGEPATVAGALAAWFAGDPGALDAVPVDLAGLAPFAHAVLTTLRCEVPWGETVSYGELAALAGRPGAARAVGGVMAANPVPFVVPCHRVLAAGFRLGGYGGTRSGDALALKRSLLAREGIEPRP